LDKVGSTYTPSGRTTVSGVVCMLIAVPVGALTAALVALVIFIVGVTLSTIVSSASTLGAIGLFYGGVMLSLAAGGAVAGAIVAAAGNIGKNRNSNIAAGFGVMPSLLFSIALMVSSSSIPGLGDYDTNTLGPFLLPVMIIGSLLSLPMAIIYARKGVREHKFCESCFNGFKKYKLPVLSSAGTRQAVVRLEKGNIRAAAIAIKDDYSKPLSMLLSWGIPVAYVCKGCGRGYLEITCIEEHSQGSWSNPNQVVRQSTLVASTPIEKEDSDYIVANLRKRPRPRTAVTAGNVVIVTIIVVILCLIVIMALHY
jgi:hypothetical protein